MWPVFIGFQLVKTVLVALFLPSIIGSLGKIVGKGLSSVSSFGHPQVETPEDLDFKDNHFNSDMMDSLDAAPQTSYEQYAFPNGKRTMSTLNEDTVLKNPSPIYRTPRYDDDGPSNVRCITEEPE